jgi:NAD(P)-dependent dehydrogenase (short-subunit alcohol dehydrogenase family)
MGRLDGKVAFITGVGLGQGRSHAIRLAEEGADIIGVDSLTDVDTTSYPMATQEDLDETTVLLEKTGRRAILSRADVRDREGLQRASAAALRFGLHLGDYTAAKAGVIALAKTLANEVAAERIRVNAICPGTLHAHSDCQRAVVQGLSARSGESDISGLRTRIEDIDADGTAVAGARRRVKHGGIPRQRRSVVRHRNRDVGRRGLRQQVSKGFEDMSQTIEAVVPLSNTGRFFIDGEWVKPSSDAVIDVIDSATEQLYFQVPEAQPADMDLAIGAARRAFDRGRGHG